MSNELLIIYNICGTDGKDITRLDRYVESIHSILDQQCDFPINLCISSCLNSDSTIGTLQDHFFDSADICRIQEATPPIVCFNKAAQECVKRYGDYIGYLLVNSNKVFKYQFIIKNLWNLYKQYGDKRASITDVELFICDIFQNNRNEVIPTDIIVNYDKLKGEFWQKV